MDGYCWLRAAIPLNDTVLRALVLIVAATEVRNLLIVWAARAGEARLVSVGLGPVVFLLGEVRVSWVFEKKM
jgi:hypothetical protein